MTTWDEPSLIDRAEDRRGAVAWVGELWSSPGTRVLPVDEHGAFATGERGSRLRFVEATGSYRPQEHLLLGLVEGTAYFAAPAVIDDDKHTIREVGGLLGDVDRELATTAAALTHWHRAEPRCPQCGRPTEIRKAGAARFCRHDDRELFPRTDPAIIVAVTDPEDRLLLASQVVWGPHRVSVLAGFNEAGESLEQTVHREVFEESGVRLKDVRYFGSQPWPMPRSLMLGFSAVAASTDIVVDGTEIGAADWYTRDRVRAEVESEHLILPGSSSIANRLITAWLEGRLRD